MRGMGGLGGWFHLPPAESIPPQCSAIAAHVHTYHGPSASIMLAFQCRNNRQEDDDYNDYVTPAGRY